MIKALFRICVAGLLLVLLRPNAGAQPYNIIITTTTIPPVDLFINQALTANGSGIRVTIQNSGTTVATLRLLGSLDQNSPLKFSVSLRKSYRPSRPIVLQPGQTIFLTNAVLSESFGNFRENDLQFQSINFNDLKDGLNYKLPEGIYNICLEAREFNSDIIRSAPQTGCSIFTLCNKASAPQFTQPVNNLNIGNGMPVVNVLPTQIFTWTPPLANCALTNSAFTYEFEIREILDNQTINDVTNNPYVFRKTSIPSATFLFDANLYKNILKPGNRYAIRVRALNASRNSPVVLDNNGFSRLEAFQYGETKDIVNVPGPYDLQSYYLTFSARKSNYWNDVYNAQASDTGKDTLIDVKNFIALKLMQQDIAYNLDAIELFLSLNPGLTSVKSVKISYAPRFPDLPRVGTTTKAKFDDTHMKNLSPDPDEVNKLQVLVDSLNASGNLTRYSGNIATSLAEVLQSVNQFKAQANAANRVSVSFLNSLLSELLFILRSGATRNNDTQNKHLEEVLTATNEIIASASLVLNRNLKPDQYAGNYTTERYPANKFQFSFASYHPQRNLFAAGQPPASSDPLLQLNVVVFRKRTAPMEPVLNAPDLTATFRIFYTLQTLYNYRNPEVNSKTVNQLASTTQVSLPRSSIYKFWSLNMLDHKLTKATDVDIKDLVEKSKKAGTGNIPTILIKVD